MEQVNGILLIYHRKLLINDAFTIYENIDSFELNSEFQVWKINTELGFPKQLSKLKFDIIVLHYSLFGMGSYYELKKPFLDYLLSSQKSHIIAFFQDDYRHCQPRFKFIDDYKIQSVYTCLPEKYHHLVYGKFTKAKYIFNYLCGYTTEEMKSLNEKFGKPFNERKIDISYRARQLAYYMGKGAQEKHKIGEEFKRLINEKKVDINIDISNRIEDRIYGNDWYYFMGNSKAVLGVEAGVSIIDLHDEVLPACEKYLNENPLASFQEVHDKILCNWENNIPYRLISPRVFEAVALKTVLVFFEGGYSGIIKPDIHYIPLKKDFSNFEEVISKLKDNTYCNNLVTNAFNDLILSDNYSYKTFISQFDTHLIKNGFSPNKIVEHQYIDLKLNKGYKWRKLKILPKSVTEKLVVKYIPENTFIRKIITKLRILLID